MNGHSLAISVDQCKRARAVIQGITIASERSFTGNRNPRNQVRVSFSVIQVIHPVPFA
jgi:hypothetical protein